MDEIREFKIDNMSYYEELAFWLNAYNMLVVDSVLSKLEKKPNWNGPTTFFGKIKFFILERHKVANMNISLYSLENKIIRRKFNDPRIHFALNCATNSCPYLPKKFFTSDMINQELEKLSRNFVNEQNGVIVKDNLLYVSRIFKWYKNDFGGKSGIMTFINNYWEGKKLDEQLKIVYMDYDWTLNKLV